MRNKITESKKEFVPTFFLCPFGLLYDAMQLGLRPTHAKIFAYLVEQYGGYNYQKKYNVPVQISQKQLKSVANTKSNSHVAKVINDLVQLKLIAVEDCGGSKKAAKYKIIDSRFLPLKMRLFRGEK